jgi:hypothetical protein
MAKSRTKAGGGTASSIVTTAIGLYLGNSDHPHLAEAFYCIAILAGMYALIQWSVVQKILGLQPIPLPLNVDDKPELADNSGNQAGRDNNGIQLNATQSANIFGDDAVKRLFPSPPVTEPSWPTLKCDQVILLNVRYDDEEGIWVEDDKSQFQIMAVKVWFPSQKVESNRTSMNVYATLRFHGIEGTSEHINRAFWINYAANVAHMKMGDQRLLLLGYVKSRRWISFENIYERPRSDDFYAYDPERPHPQGKTLKEDCDGALIELSLFNSRAGLVGSSNYTVRRQPNDVYDVAGTG